MGGFRHSGGGVEENRLKRCLKGGGVGTDTPGGGWIWGFVLVSQGVSHTNICGNWSMTWRKVRGISHLSHGEIVLVTSDDDILSYKVWHRLCPWNVIKHFFSCSPPHPPDICFSVWVESGGDVSYVGTRGIFCRWNARHIGQHIRKDET